MNIIRKCSEKEAMIGLAFWEADGRRAGDGDRLVDRLDPGVVLGAQNLLKDEASLGVTDGQHGLDVAGWRASRCGDVVRDQGQDDLVGLGVGR